MPGPFMDHFGAMFSLDLYPDFLDICIFWDKVYLVHLVVKFLAIQGPCSDEFGAIGQNRQKDMFYLVWK